MKLVLEDQWAINGIHYSKTLEAWLNLFDQQYTAQIKPIFEATYGKFICDVIYGHLIWIIFNTELGIICHFTITSHGD